MFLSGGGPDFYPGSFPRKFPWGRKFRSLVRNIRPRKNLAKSFAFFSRVGVRNFPQKFAPEISGDRNIRPLTPELPASRGCNGQILEEAINSLLLPQEVAAHFYSLSSIVANLESLIPPPPSNDYCPFLGKQERRFRSTIPPIHSSSK